MMYHTICVGCINQLKSQPLKIFLAILNGNVLMCLLLTASY